MNNIQYDQWMCKTLSSLNKTEPELMKDYYFNKIIYWKLEQSHNQPIQRDRKLFASLLPVLIDTWSKVKYYREHLDELPKLREIVEKRKKYIKTNTDFKINNDVIKNGVLFLEDYKHSIVKKTPVSKNLKNDEDCDFIDEPISKEKLIPKTKESVIKTIKTIPKKQAKKKEESDKEDNGEYKVNKTTFKKSFVKETECEFID
jgi:hypothetical protein